MKRLLLALAGLLLVAPPASAQVASARSSRASAPSEADAIPGLRGFSVVLVLGDLKAGAAAADSVPAAATKALADMKDFLPYKSYRLLDTQWTAGSGQMTGRLHGPDGKEYELELTTRRGAAADAPVTISRFLLREAPAGDAWQLLAGRGLLPLSGADAKQDKTNRAATTWKIRGNLIDTSFSMDLGETVVVGTSRLQGDTALIVLLTAASRADAALRGRLR